MLNILFSFIFFLTIIIMSGILNLPPTLNYIGAIDTSSSTSGQTMYSVLLDQTIPGLGNILMFEYKYITTGDDVTPQTVELGYVSIENAINSGISNQWSIAIPAENSVYNPTPTIKVAVRAYVGLIDGTEIGVTEWSNELDMYVPPPQQTIIAAYYDANSYAYGNDDLYVFLQPNSDIVYSGTGSVKFVAAFYYKNNTGGSTVWDVSEPVSAVPVTLGVTDLMMLHIPEFGIVSDTDQHIYVAVYATYMYEYSGNNYFSVSEVSTTKDAEPATNYLSPTIDSIDYSVYADSSTQTMTVNWTAPGSAGIPTYTVDTYILYISTDDENWTEVVAGLPSTQLSYNVDVSSYACGTTLYYRVEAVSTAGTLSPPSATTDLSYLNMFRYASAPLNLKAIAIVQDGLNLGMTVEFDTPETDGCGDTLKFVIIVDGTERNNTLYVQGQESYSIILSNLPYAQSGSIEVYLVTKDTNPTQQGGNIFNDQNGASANIGYFAVNLVLQPIIYDVYQYGNTDQEMHLEWNNPAAGVSGWDVIKYDIYLTVTGNNPVPRSLIYTMDVNNLSLSYIYDATNILCENNMSFEIIATVTDTETIYTIDSNDEYVNKFLYATEPQNVQVLWSVASTNNTTMDISGQFSNPVSSGCGAVVGFVVEILDAQYNIIDSQIITHVIGNSLYSVNFDNITYSPTGYMNVYLQTINTNSSTTMNGLDQIAPYISDNLPIFTNVLMNADRTQFSFDILTHTSLVPEVIALYNVGQAQTKKQWYTTNVVQTGVTVDQTTLVNSEIKYSVIMLPNFVDPQATSFPDYYGVAVANTVGIQFLESVVA